MKNVYSTNPSYGLSTIKGFIYQSFNTLQDFILKKQEITTILRLYQENIIYATFL